MAEHEIILAKLIAVIDGAEREGVDAKPIFHACARLFGEALSRYLEPADALAFMAQEARRMRLVIAAGQSSQPH